MLPDLSLALFFTLIILFLTVGVTWYYKKCISIYSDFPSVNFLKESIKLTWSGKIPKNTPAQSFFFQHWVDICKKFQSHGLCLVWILRPYLFVFNEETFKVFANDPTNIDKPFDFNIFKEYWGTSLLTSSGDLWRKRRKMLNPLFYKSMLKDNAPMMNKNAKILVKNLMEHTSKESILLIKHFKICAFMNIYEYLSGMDFNKEENYPEAKEATDIVTETTAMTTLRIFQPWLHPKFMMMLFAKGRRFLKIVKKGHDATIEYLRKMGFTPLSYETDRKEAKIREEYQATRVNFSELIKEHALKDPSFTFRDVKDEFTGLLTAGYDTVSYALMWSMFLLGHHPEIQERLFEEVDSVMESRNALSGEDVQNMRYLESVIKESLRLYPPIPIFGRYISNEVKCGKYTVPKGTNILFILYSAGRDPNVFPDPEKFDPDRFLEMNSESSMLTLTFAEGARNCIGKHFALLELKIVLAHLIKNFKVTSLDRPEDVTLSWEVVLTTKEPLRFKLSPRCGTQQTS